MVNTKDTSMMLKDKILSIKKLNLPLALGL